MNPAETLSAPTAREVNLEVQLRAAVEIVRGLEQDKRDLTGLVSAKNVLITRLETEIGRLRMTRTDRELAVQVDGLRIEVGKKDRELVELRKRIEVMLENEKLTLRRAAAANQKVATVQHTLVTMQRARDAAQIDTERHDRERLEAVAQMVAASDRAAKAEARLAELEGAKKKPETKK